ncbi:hypothetical protein [Agromyces bauzanensis]
MSENDFIDIPTAATWMDVSEETMRRFVRSGIVKAYRFGPTLIRIKVEDLLGSLVEVA